MMARALQRALLLLLVAAFCCCKAGACRHTPSRTQYQHRASALYLMMQLASDQPFVAGDDCSTARDKDKCLALPGCTYCKNKFSPMPGSDGVCRSADQAKLLPATGYKCKSAAPQQQQHVKRSSAHLAAAGKQPAGGDDNCGKIHEQKKCLHRSDTCVWCQNKYSPFPGSDGVCTTPDQAQYLPDSTYKCSKIHAAQHASNPTVEAHPASGTAAAAAAAGGGGGGEKPDHPGKSCSSVHVKKQCAKQHGCIWCQNMFSPTAGSDGVCIEPEFKKQLPKWTYKCSDDGQARGKKQTVPGAAVAAA